MTHCSMTFAVYRGAALERRTTTDQEIVRLGRDPNAHLHLADDDASRAHAVIEVGSEERITLVDLGHATGTRVNGSSVKKCRLQVGDRIQVGETVVILESITPVARTTTAPSPAPAVETFGSAASGDFSPGSSGAIDPFAVASRVTASSAFDASLGMDLRNPFAAAALRNSEPLVVPENADPSPYAYSLVKTGPDVAAEEVELAGVETIEVMILWGHNVLRVEHLTPPRSFYVGEDERASLGVDCFIPAEHLGTTRLPLVLADASGPRVVLPASARGTFCEGKTRRTLDEMRAEGMSCTEFAGATEVALPRGASVRFEVGDFAFIVASVNAGKPARRGLGAGFDSAIATSFGLSFFAGAALIATMAATVPAMGLVDSNGIDKDQVRTMQRYLATIAEKERDRIEEPSIVEEPEPGSQGGQGTRAQDEEGAMGKINAKATNKRWGAKGPSNAVVELARNRAPQREEVETFGIIRLLSGGDPNAPTVKWGGDHTVGNDEISALGNMWGDAIGESGGMGGLGLSGIGEGGGGRGEGIGLDRVGTYSHGAGCVGTNCVQGFGRGGNGFGSREHTTKVPTTRTGNPQISGRIPPEVIQRIVRQNHGRFRMCYEQGLVSNPNLEGRVVVRFVIDNNGAVSFAGNGGGDLPSSEVNSCVVRAFYGLSFPAPEGGVVKVAYPILFSPG